eukprot:TRINITY_DN14527_c0_g2_i1.p1 TRINITY_DN14527_c0_g2~~TRINITY_DN14527_c0_g2_i1.p1  ORF type:complete len:505 (+),score=98.71 TRINITY_DN14527_c0_g2_i1:58-1572(+)
MAKPLATTLPLQLVNDKLNKLGTAITEISAVYEIVGCEEDVNLEGNPEPGYLGRGTYGLVKRMKKRGTEQIVAVKEMKKKRFSTPKQLQHALIEIAVMKTLNHPGCLKLHEVLHTDESLYLVTTLCKGELYDLIQVNGTLTAVQTQIIMKQLLDTLSYLHGVGVIHRDVKPENILINPDTLLIKLIDFGLAKFIPKPPASSASLNSFPPVKHDGSSPLPGTLKATSAMPSPVVAVTPFTCTEYYASLEAIQGMLDHTTGGKKTWQSSRSSLPKVDIYGAGVVCYAMLVGRLPYLAHSSTHKATDDRLRELKKLMMSGLNFPQSASSLPTESLDFVTKLMNHDTASRPTAQEALLHPWMLGVVTPAHPATPGISRMVRKEEVISGSKVIEAKEKVHNISAPPVRKKKARKSPQKDSDVPGAEVAKQTLNAPGAETSSGKALSSTVGSESGQSVGSSGSKESGEFVFKDSPSPAPSPADRSQFKDGWGSIMRNLREGEDSDVEEKD